MTLIRVWDKEFTLLTSIENDNLSAAMQEAEVFARTQPPADVLHYTIDPIGPQGGFRYRNGGQLIRYGTGAVEWRDNRDLLRYITVPSVEFAKYSLDRPLGPGDKVAVEIGGQIYTDTIHSIHTETSEREPVAGPRRPRWQRFIRAITPRRWRKTTLWTPPGGGTSTVITTIGDGPAYQIDNDFSVGKRTTWPEIVAEMAQSEPDEPNPT